MIVCVSACGRDPLPGGTPSADLAAPNPAAPDLNPCPPYECFNASLGQPCTPSSCCGYSSPPALLCGDTGHWTPVSHCVGDAPPDFGTCSPSLTLCDSQCVDTSHDIR